MDIHTTANGINNFKHSTSPQNGILRKQAGTGHSLKDYQTIESGDHFSISGDEIIDGDNAPPLYA